MKSERGFRTLLILGGIVSVALAFCGLVSTKLLTSALGLDIGRRAMTGGAAGLGRIFGAAMLAVGVGYFLAGAHPQRSRSLLVPLFVLPAVTAVAVIAATARGEIKGAQGAIFAIYNAAYCLLYFRMYPRVMEAVVKPDPGTAKPIPPRAPGDS